MTPSQIEIEWRYRYLERLGILGTDEAGATPEQIEIARGEAEQWKREYLGLTKQTGADRLAALKLA